MQMVFGTQQHDAMVEFYTLLGWSDIAASEDGTWTQMHDGSMTILIWEDTSTYMGPGYFSADAPEVFEKLDELDVEYVSNIDKDGARYQSVFWQSDSVGISVTHEEVELPENKNLGVIFGNMDLTLIEYPNPVLGVYQEFSVSVENLEDAISYYENLGFQSTGINQSIYRYTIMYDGLLILGLHETKGMWYGNLLTYSGASNDDNEILVEALKSSGYESSVHPLMFGGKPYPGSYYLTDPDGNVVFLTNDFAKRD